MQLAYCLCAAGLYRAESVERRQNTTFIIARSFVFKQIVMEGRIRMKIIPIHRSFAVGWLPELIV